MKNFSKLLPVAAVLMSFSPLAANAAVSSAAAHVAVARAAQMVAVNSKGRPGEFAVAAYTKYSFSSAPSQNADGAPIQTGG